MNNFVFVWAVLLFFNATAEVAHITFENLTEADLAALFPAELLRDLGVGSGYWGLLGAVLAINSGMFAFYMIVSGIVNEIAAGRRERAQKKQKENGTEKKKNKGE